MDIPPLGAENFVGSANIGRPRPQEQWVLTRSHIVALLLGLTGAMTAAIAIYAPTGAVVVLGGLLTLGLTQVMRGRAWLLLCWVVIPAIGAGELWTFEIGDGTVIAPSLFVVTLCATAFFLAVLHSKDQPFWHLPLIGAFAAFWLAILLSAIHAVSVLHWARGLCEAILGFAFFAYPYVYLRNRRQLSLCLCVLICLAAFTVVFGILQYVWFDAFRNFFPFMYSQRIIPTIEEWQASGRMVANWGYSSDFGSLLNIAAPIALYFCLNTKKNRSVSLLVFLLIASGIFLTATRTPIIAFCLSNTLLFFLMRGRRAGLYVATASALILVLVLSPLFSVGLKRFNFSEPENLITVEGRGLMWLEAASFFIQHPLIGIGARNFLDLAVTEKGMGTHNVYLEVAAETGAIGLMAFLYLLYRALRIDLNRGRSALPQDLQNLRYALLCSSLSIVLESFTDNDFYVWQVWCLFWLIRGLSAAIASRPEAFQGGLPNSNAS